MPFVLLAFAWSNVAGLQESAVQTKKSSFQPDKYYLAPYKVAAISVDNTIWIFQADSDKPGVVRLRVLNGDGAQQKDFHLGEGVGPVVGVVAASRKLGGRHLIVVGVVVTTVDCLHLEYRVAAGYHSESKSIEWHCSSPVERRSLEEPFELMSIALPGGDSMVFDLQDFERGRDAEQKGITTLHATAVVNHCVFPALFNNIMMIHKSSESFRDRNAMAFGMEYREAITSEPVENPGISEHRHQDKK